MVDSKQKIQIDLDAPSRKTARVILEAWFERDTVKDSHVAAMGALVDVYLIELWAPIRKRLRAAEMRPESIERIRRRVILETWLQFTSDMFGEKYELVASPAAASGGAEE